MGGDSDDVERLVKDIDKDKKRFSGMVVSGGKFSDEYINRGIGDMAKNQEVSVGEVAVRLLKMSGGDAVIQSAVFSEDCIHQAAQNQRSIISTGDAGYDVKKVGKDFLHRRAFGTMTKFLSEFCW